MRAVFLDFGTVSNGDLDPAPLERVPGIVIHAQTAQLDVPARSRFRGRLRQQVRDRRATIQANPQLKMVALTATGVDNVDLAAAREAGIAVQPRDYCTASVAQHVRMLLALTHRLAEYHAGTRRAMAGGEAVLVFLTRSAIAGPGVRHRRPRHLGKSVAGSRALGMRVEIANRPAARPPRGGGTSMTCSPNSTCSPCTARSRTRPAAS
jgi:glycerate dehydrogenase